MDPMVLKALPLCPIYFISVTLLTHKKKVASDSGCD